MNPNFTAEKQFYQKLYSTDADQDPSDTSLIEWLSDHASETGNSDARKYLNAASELLNSTALILRGMCLDPRVPISIREILFDRAIELEVTLKTIDTSEDSNE